MAEISHHLDTQCTKCITMEFAEEEDKKKRYHVWHRQYPDLAELVKHFGSKDAWAMAKEWPDNGVLFRECKKCNYVWVTTTYDNWEITDLTDEQ